MTNYKKFRTLDGLRDEFGIEDFEINESGYVFIDTGSFNGFRTVRFDEYSLIEIELETSEEELLKIYAIVEENLEIEGIGINEVIVKIKNYAWTSDVWDAKLLFFDTLKEAENAFNALKVGDLDNIVSQISI